MRRLACGLLLCAVVAVASAQERVLQMADSIVKYQMKSGGWPKNQDWLEGVSEHEAGMWAKTGIGSTIDNGATVTEMRTLVKAVDKLEDIKAASSDRMNKMVLESDELRYREAFVRGLQFLLAMQYPNGGFPQFHPARSTEDYSSQITFNDNAMVNVMRLLKGVADEDTQYKNIGVDKGLRRKCRAAYERGLQCVMNCQIRVDESGRVLTYGTEEWKKGRRTVWCQQHDKMTLAPTKARAYELPSYTAHGETVDLIELLMDEQDQTAEVKEAINGAVEWLKAHAMKDVTVEHFTNEDGEKDIRMAKKKGAPLLWARFYDLESGEPMYCDRDGVPRKSLSEIGYERRNGYQWVGDSPQRVIDRYEKK